MWRIWAIIAVIRTLVLFVDFGATGSLDWDGLTIIALCACLAAVYYKIDERQRAAL